MKKILIGMFLLIGITMSSYAQKQCSTRDGNWTCVETSKGRAYAIYDNKNGICYSLEIKDGNGCTYVKVNNQTDWTQVREFLTSGAIESGVERVLSKVVKIGKFAAGTIAGAIVQILEPSPAY
jgi:hypothetical protein